MKKVLTFCSVFMMVIINASDNKSEPTVEPESNNVNPDMQLTTPELLPVEVDKIKKQRIEKSVREKKYAESVLKNRKSVSKYQNDVVESISERNQKEDVLKRWSLDARSKISVATVKGANGEKAIKLPSAPTSN